MGSENQAQVCSRVTVARMPPWPYTLGTLEVNSEARVILLCLTEGLGMAADAQEKLATIPK